jgi:hypothetical protein
MTWRRMGDLRYGPTILKLSTRLRWMVSFAPRPLYPPVKGPRYPLGKRLSGLQRRFGRCREEKISFLCRVQNPAVQYVACRYIDWAIPTRPGIYLEGLRKTIKTSTKVLSYRSGLEPSTSQIRFHNVTATHSLRYTAVYTGLVIVRNYYQRTEHVIDSIQRQQGTHSKSMNKLIWQQMTHVCLHKLRS